MSDTYSRKILKVVVAHCSNTIGWNAIQGSSLDLLTDVLHKYIYEIGRATHRYSEQFGRTEPNLDDLGLAFQDMGVNIADLSDFVNVETTPFQENLPLYPIPREPQLNFLKHGSHEVLTRPVHVHDHLPPMLPPAVEEEEQVAETMQDINEGSPIPPENIESGLPGMTPSPRTIFKRPEMQDKRSRTWLEDEGQPLREITSVMMTTSGYLSSSREGKLPESRMPRPLPESEPEPTQVPEKKVTMRKLIEVFRKDEATKKNKDTEREEEKEREKEREKEKEKEREREREEAAEKEKEREKELEKEKEKEKEKEPEKEKEKKEKPKRKRKEKVMEEFNFFDEKAKEKAPVIGKSSSPVVETKLQADPTKQKLNIFRKITKPKELDHQATPSPGPSADRSITPVGTLDKLSQPYQSSSHDESDAGRVSPAVAPGTPFIPRTPEAPMPLLPPAKKVVKNERKPKVRKVKAADAQLFPTPQPLPEKMAVREEPPWSAKEETTALWAPESVREEPKAKDQPASTFDSMSPPAKKKRSRPVRVPSDVVPPTSGEPPPTPEMPPPTPPTPTGLTATKPFFPFANPFGAPGLIPPPLFQNLPFNLLGMAPGLRPPLGLPPHLAPLGLAGANLPMFLPQAAKIEAAAVKTPSPPKPAPLSTAKSPERRDIVDSLPDSGPPPPPQLPQPAAIGAGDDETLGPAALLNKKKDKREKKEKGDKEKKKKEKKFKGDKADVKDDKDKEKKIKKEKKKERKDKEKAKVDVEVSSMAPSTVPKITFKFGAAPNSPRPATPESTPKLIFKPMAEREAPAPVPAFGGASSSPAPAPAAHPPLPAPPPDVAKFSALVTRPPKTPKPAKKEPTPSAVTPAVVAATAAASTAAAAAAAATTAALAASTAALASKLPTETTLLPLPTPVADVLAAAVGEKIPTGTSPLPSTSALATMMGGLVPRTPSPSPKVRREKPQKPPRVTKDPKDAKDKDLKDKKKSDKPGDVAVITETVGSYYDEFGNKIWICPACGRQDDGTPMIGCDECDDWYHWVCVGIRVPPADAENWYCQRCIAKKQGSLMDKKKGRKKKSL